MALHTQAIQVLKVTRADDSELSVYNLTHWPDLCASLTYTWTDPTWAKQLLSSAQFPNTPSGFCVLVLSEDVSLAGHDGVDFVSKLVANPSAIVGVNANLKFVKAVPQDAADAFTGGDLQLFRDMINGLRDYNGIA